MALGLGHLVVRRHRDVTSGGAAAGPLRRAERCRVAERGAAEVAAQTDAAGRAESEVAAGVVGAAVGRERLELKAVCWRRVAADGAVLAAAAAHVAPETDDDDDDERQDEEDGEDEAGENDQTARVRQQR